MSTSTKQWNISIWSYNNHHDKPLHWDPVERDKIRAQLRYWINLTQMNRASKKLRLLLREEKANAMKSYLENLSPSRASDYTLWKATKKLKQPKTYIPPIRNGAGSWLRAVKRKQSYLQNTLRKYLRRTKAKSRQLKKLESINFSKKYINLIYLSKGLLTQKSIIP